jgi:Bacterial Ig domain
VDGVGTPTVTITSPTNGQHAGPATNLEANAGSPNGPIVQYRVMVDGMLMKVIPGAPSFQAWIVTPMGRHTITVKAEDVTQQWGTASVWIVRTY